MLFLFKSKHFQGFLRDVTPANNIKCLFALLLNKYIVLKQIKDKLQDRVEK